MRNVLLSACYLLLPYGKPSERWSILKISKSTRKLFRLSGFSLKLFTLLKIANRFEHFSLKIHTENVKMWKCENVQRKFNRGKNLLTHYSTHSFDSSASMNEVWRLWKLRKKSFHFPWLFRSANQTLSFSTFQLMKNWISMENQQWFSQIYSHLWTPRKAQNHGTQQTDFSELH